MEQSVSKRRRIKFRRWGITQKKADNILKLSFKMENVLELNSEETVSNTNFKKLKSTPHYRWAMVMGI